MSERFNIRGLVGSRSADRSYHVAAEKHVRIEFRNMRTGDSVEPFVYGGDVVVTCYRGHFTVSLSDERSAFPIGELDQIVISEGTRAQLDCSGDGTLQFIWSPAQAPSVKG